MPVVAFDQGVAQDSVIDGLNGYLVPCFNIDIFANSVFKSIFLNNFNFNDEKNKNLKNVFNSLNEAKTLVEFAEDDYKKKYKQ